MTIEIVFFDAGETLLRPYPSFPELFARTCRDAGHDLDADDVERVQSEVAPHLLELVEESGVEKPSLSAEGSRRFWVFLYRRFLTELGIHTDSLAERLYDVFSSSASYKLFDDVVPALTSLEDAGYRLGLISNFEGWLEKMLVELEIGHRFDTAVISGLEGVEKPDPEIYRIALEKAGVDGGRAVHVGDSPTTDVAPASEVGITAVLLDRHGRYGDAPGPKIAGLEELPALMENLHLP